MAEALEIRIGDLFPEFLAHTFGIFRSLEAAGAISAGHFQAFPNRFDNFLVFVQPYSHGAHFLSNVSFIIIG